MTKRKYSYTGNANENYTLLENGKEILELICGEDHVMELVTYLNNGAVKVKNALMFLEDIKNEN